MVGCRKNTYRSKSGFALETKNPLAVAGKGSININYPMDVTILPTLKM
jgi:hypothetical protein